MVLGSKVKFTGSTGVFFAVMAITHGVSAVCWAQSSYYLLLSPFSHSQCAGLVMPRFRLCLVVYELWHINSLSSIFSTLSLVPF